MLNDEVWNYQLDKIKEILVFVIKLSFEMVVLDMLYHIGAMV